MRTRVQLPGTCVKPGQVTRVCNLRSREAEMGGFLAFQVQYFKMSHGSPGGMAERLRVLAEDQGTGPLLVAHNHP